MTTSDMRNTAKNRNFAILYGRRAGMSTNAAWKRAIDLHRTMPWTLIFGPSPEYPGGAKKFVHLMNVWTRDLLGPGGLRHEFVQYRQNVFCARCRLHVSRFAGDTKVPRPADIHSKNARDTFRGPRIRGVAPQALRKAVREIIRLMGPCEFEVIKSVMEC